MTSRWMAGFILSAFLLDVPCSVGEESPAMTGEPLIEAVAMVADGEVVHEAPEPGDSLRVGFYNIEMFTDGIKDGKNRTAEQAGIQARGAARIVSELGADILLVSEVENDRVMRLINQVLDHPYPYGFIAQFGTGSGRIEKMNIGLFSRYPVESVHEIDFGPLGGKDRPTRGVLRAIVPLGSDAFLLLYGVHLKANWGDRARNVAQRVHALEWVLRDIRQVKGTDPARMWETVVVGDFNTDPLLDQFKDDPTLQVLKDWVDLFNQHPGVSELFTVPTRHGNPMREFPPALFDRFLVMPEVTEKPWQASLPGVIMQGTETTDNQILPGQGNHVSDHYPVFIDLAR